jgi:hypothetical protein
VNQPELTLETESTRLAALGRLVALKNKIKQQLEQEKQQNKGKYERND